MPSAWQSVARLPAAGRVGARNDKENVFVFQSEISNPQSEILKVPPKKELVIPPLLEILKIIFYSLAYIVTES